MPPNNSEIISQRVVIEGADAALKDLQNLGDRGAAAIDQIKAAGEGDFARGLKNTFPEVQKLSNGFRDASIAAGILPGQLNRVGAAAKKLRGDAGGATEDLRDGMHEAGDATVHADNKVRLFARTLRGLARATGSPELRVLAGVLRGVGQNAALIAGPAVIGGLALIANSASKATQEFQDLAFATAQTPQIFQATATAALAVGGSVENLGQALAKQPALIKAATSEEAALAAASANVSKVVADGATAYQKNLDALRPLQHAHETFRLTVALGLDAVSSINDQISALTKSYNAGKVSAEDYQKQSTRLYGQLFLAQREQRKQQEDNDKAIRDANQALADQSAANRQAEKDARAAKKALEENAGALVKLNIGAAQFKSLSLDERMKLVADQLLNMPKGIRRNELAIELFGDSARRFINELDKGRSSFADFIAEGQKIAPAFTPAQDAIGDKFTKAVDQLGASLGALKNAFGLAVAPAFVDFMNTMTDVFVKIRPGVEEFARSLGGILKPILDGIGAVISQVIVPAFQGLITIFDLLAEGINKAFGTNLTGIQLFTIAVVALIGAFFPVGALFVGLLVGIGKFSEAIKNLKWDDVKKAASAMADSVAKFFQDLWDKAVRLFADGLIAIGNLFAPAIDLIRGQWEAFKSYLQSWVDTVVQFFQPLIDRIKKISAFFSSDASNSSLANDAGLNSFAGGGAVRGRGTSTSDDILAWLSNHEFVMKAKAVRKYGVGFMRAVNEGRLDLGRLAGFKMGGLVDALSPLMPMPIPRFADGGSVAASTGGLRPVTINFDGAQFEAMMADEALDALHKKSIAHRARRAGKRPSYIGG